MSQPQAAGGPSSWRSLRVIERHGHAATVSAPSPDQHGQRQQEHKQHGWMGKAHEAVAPVGGEEGLPTGGGAVAPAGGR